MPSSDVNKKNKPAGDEAVKTRKKKAGKIIGIILKIVIAVICLVLVCKVLNYIATPAKSYTRIQFHDLYTDYGKDGENMDLLFLGTSHAYRAFDPEVFDKKLKINSYNFGTSMQTISASYYVLKEILKTNHPERVVFELTYTCFNDKDHMPLKSVILSQYMKPSLNKLQFVLNEFDFEDIFYAILPAYTFRDNLVPAKLGSILANKAKRAFKQYDPAITKSSTEWMVDKGFVYTDKSLSWYHLGKMDPEAWDEAQMSPKFLDYFHKIIDLCKQEDVELVFITAPSPKGSLLELGNYGDVCAYFDDVAAKNGIKYYNFNLLKPEALPLYNDDFYDGHHLNGKGAGRFSRLVANMFAEEKAGTYDPDNYFYRSWDEASEAIDYVTNTYMSVAEDEEHYILTGHAFSGGKDPQIEYSYWLYNGTEDSEQLLSYWSDDPTLKIRKDFRDERWRIKVAARVKGSGTPLENCQSQILWFPREADPAEEE